MVETVILQLDFHLPTLMFWIKRNGLTTVIISGESSWKSVKSSGLKGYEDWLRHVADNEVNMRKVCVLRNGIRSQLNAKDIVVGDIVRMPTNEPVPCDMLILSSSNEDGTCYVTTANLDGETNLKIFCSTADTKHLQSDESFATFRAKIICEQPTADLYNFVGNVYIHSMGGEEPEKSEKPSPVSRSLTHENILLRGSRVKNTPFVYGCAVYTGQETKISLNSKSRTSKFSRVERSMNRYLIVFLIVLVIEAATLCALKIVYYEDEKHKVETVWYSIEEKKLSFLMVLEEFLAFMVLMNYIIPISMYVTVELQKFFGSMFFQWDLDMYDVQLNEPAIANTSDLNEELGQINYLFTDKTGTLTENDMQFRQCAVGDNKYIEVNDKLCELPTIPGVQPVPLTNLQPDLYELFTVMSLCHTVTVEKNDQEANGTEHTASRTAYEYQASSPDEKALIEACRRQNIVFHGKQENYFEVGFEGKRRKFLIHQILEFDPTRKRMSIIVEDDNGEVTLMVKGAESALLDRSRNNNGEQIEKHVVDYAKLGLRTLVFAQRKLSAAEFSNLNMLLDNARKSLENRKERLAEAYSTVEQDLDLLGVTAVEDKLQDGVPDTIRSLRGAGIQVWVLTGDKEETAVNISYSAGHFYPGVEEVRFTRIRSAEECELRVNEVTELLRTCHEYGAPKYALIIDGVTLVLLLDKHSNELTTICKKVSTVLCCRMSPLQKSQVVKLIKNSSEKPTTAAIGDGANDVSMIQEAHVGIGLMGKEGRQAVRASDYAFGRFKFLKRAILVHGHYFYIRIATLVQYFFYKNIAFITAQLYYAFFSAYSTQSLYDSFCLMFFNITFTSLPILIYGLFEQNISQRELLQNPALYKKIARNSALSVKHFLRWNITGLWHSVVAFFGSYLFLSQLGALDPAGKLQIGVYDLGLMVYTTVIVICNIKLALEWYHWNIVASLSFVITFLGYFLMLLVYNVFRWDLMIVEYTLIGSPESLYGNLMVWVLLLLLVILAILPDIIYRAIRDSYSTVYRRQYQRKRRQTMSIRPISSVSLTQEKPTIKGSTYLQSITGEDSDSQSTKEDSRVLSVSPNQNALHQGGDLLLDRTTSSVANGKLQSNDQLKPSFDNPAFVGEHENNLHI